MDINELSKKLDHIESDLISDRSEIDKIKQKLDSVISMQQTLESRIPRLEDKLADAVSGAVQPLRDDIEKLIEKKILVITTRMNWWDKLTKLFGRR